jgi:hypothetical protein
VLWKGGGEGDFKLDNFVRFKNDYFSSVNLAQFAYSLKGAKLPPLKTLSSEGLYVK